MAPCDRLREGGVETRLPHVWSLSRIPCAQETSFLAGLIPLASRSSSVSLVASLSRHFFLLSFFVPNPSGHSFPLSEGLDPGERIAVVLASASSSAFATPFATFSLSFFSPGCFSLRVTRSTVKGKVSELNERREALEGSLSMPMREVRPVRAS